MALLINNTKFKNTDVTTPQLYSRIQFMAFPDGKKTGVKLFTALNKQGALNWQLIETDLPEQLVFEMAEGQTQDLATIHQLVKTELETKGFEVTIQL